MVQLKNCCHRTSKLAISVCNFRVLEMPAEVANVSLVSAIFILRLLKNCIQISGRVLAVLLVIGRYEWGQICRQKGLFQSKRKNHQESER